MRFLKYGLVFTAILLLSCVEKAPQKVVIGINPWPGYEFLYLAEHEGFFSKVGVNISLVEMVSLADTQRAYLSGRIDGMTSTMIEVVQAAQLGDNTPQVVLIPDYSNGGDIIIANKNIADVAGLKGKTVGCEISSLGLFMLYRALNEHGLSLDDIKIVNVEQLQGEEVLLKGDIDAFVSYPPVSIKVLKHAQYHKIFSSADIPMEIIDTISVSTKLVEENAALIPGLHEAWAMALEFAAQHPQEAYRIMAEREGVPPVSG